MMRHIVGILGLLVAICLFTAWRNPDFLTAFNIENLTRRTSLYAVIAIGAAFVIITGGIDLSIGSVIGLVGCLLPLSLVEHGWPVWLALVFVMGVALGIGLLHGLLVTKLGLQPFVVTLCGLLLYRGVARWITADKTMGWEGGFDGLRALATGEIPVPFMEEFGIPIPFVIMMVLAVTAAIFLNKTIWGRHLLALGRNEEAARYSGVNTHRMIILAYVICSGLAGIAGILFALYVPAVQPASHGNFFELYAIAAAVLGGCSLRGGEGSIAGVVIGAAVMRVLYNSINILGIPTQLEFAIIGAVILAGVVVDELIKRMVARQRTGLSRSPPSRRSGR